jgi:hypothetical protein
MKREGRDVFSLFSDHPYGFFSNYWRDSRKFQQKHQKSYSTYDRKGMSLSTRDTATHDYEVKVCVPPSCYGEKAWTSSIWIMKRKDFHS